MGFRPAASQSGPNSVACKLSKQTRLHAREVPGQTGRSIGRRCQDPHWPGLISLSRAGQVISAVRPV